MACDFDHGLLEQFGGEFVAASGGDEHLPSALDRGGDIFDFVFLEVRFELVEVADFLRLINLGDLALVEKVPDGFWGDRSLSAAEPIVRAAFLNCRGTSPGAFVATV